MFCFLSSKNGAEVDRKNRDNLIPLDLVKDTECDLADLLRGEAALLDAAKKGDIDRVINHHTCNAIVAIVTLTLFCNDRSKNWLTVLM